MPVQVSHHIVSQENILRQEKSKPEQAEKGEGWVIDSSFDGACCRSAGKVICSYSRTRQCFARVFDREASGRPDAGVAHTDTHPRGLPLMVWVVAKRLLTHVDGRPVRSRSACREPA